MMDKPLILKICLFSLLLFIAMVSFTKTKDISSKIPDRVDSWTLSETHTYTSENLFEYINGGAELYKSFGFKATYSGKYVCEYQPDLILDIFEMNNPEDAFGVFTFSAEKYDSSFGNSAQYGEGFLLFWMDRFFISIMSYPVTPESAKAVKLLGRIMESVIESPGSLPQILKYLPEEGLVEGSVRYFHHPAWLNTHYFISGENILHIDNQTEAVLAKYGNAPDKIILLLVLYQNEELAEAGFLEFKKHYFSNQTGKDFIRIEDDTYAGCIRTEKLVVAVFNARSENEAKLLADKAVTLYQ